MEQQMEAVQINTVKNYEGFTIVASKKHLPMGNNFLQQVVICEQPEPNEVQAYVKCTANSKEPGRVYFVAYSKTTGALIECYTID